MASSISSLPLQPQGQGDTGSSQAAAAASTTVAASGNSPSSSSASGSIGPFLAVISVLTFLALVSCVVGRICIRRRMTAKAVTPLDTIKHEGWLGWLKLKCVRCCMAGEVVDLSSAKVMSFGDDKNNDSHPQTAQV